MKPPTHDTQDCATELRPAPHGTEVNLDEYIAEANQRIAIISNRVRLEEEVDWEARNWLLSQVEFVVDTLGDEKRQLGEDLQSRLLQLLLAIANLNEEVRRQESAIFQTR
jgi:flagellar biosynthesis regulator FlaF